MRAVEGGRADEEGHRRPVVQPRRPAALVLAQQDPWEKISKISNFISIQVSIRISHEWRKTLLKCCPIASDVKSKGSE